MKLSGRMFQEANKAEV